MDQIVEHHPTESHMVYGLVAAGRLYSTWLQKHVGVFVSVCKQAEMVMSWLATWFSMNCRGGLSEPGQWLCLGPCTWTVPYLILWL